MSDQERIEALKQLIKEAKEDIAVTQRDIQGWEDEIWSIQHPESAPMERAKFGVLDEKGEF